MRVGGKDRGSFHESSPASSGGHPPRLCEGAEGQAAGHRQGGQREAGVPGGRCPRAGCEAPLV